MFLSLSSSLPLSLKINKYNVKKNASQHTVLWSSKRNDKKNRIGYSEATPLKNQQRLVLEPQGIVSPVLHYAGGSIAII